MSQKISQSHLGLASSRYAFDVNEELAKESAFTPGHLKKFSIPIQNDERSEMNPILDPNEWPEKTKTFDFRGPDFTDCKVVDVSTTSCNVLDTPTEK